MPEYSGEERRSTERRTVTDKVYEILMDMNVKLTEVHTVVFKNGLAKNVAQLQEDVKDGHLTCPIGKEIAEHIRVHEVKKYQLPAGWVIVFAILTIGVPILMHFIWR
jgi:hypothetical protein